MPKKSLDARNHIANATAGLIDVGSLYPAGRIELWTSIGPQTPDDPTTGIKLSTLYFSNPAFKPAFNGVALSNPLTTDFSIATSGTPQWYRIYNRDGIAVFDGLVSAVGGYAYAGYPGEIQFDKINFIAGGVCAINSISITVPLQ